MTKEKKSADIPPQRDNCSFSIWNGILNYYKGIRTSSQRKK